MDLRKCLFTNNPRYKDGRQITPKGIMVHSTGANNPSLARYLHPDDGSIGRNIYGNHWNRPDQDVCVHAFIGKLKSGAVASYQVLPWACRAAHCGKGSKGSANNTHIAFEICEDTLTDAAYFNAVYREAVELTAHLCKAYRLNPLHDGVVICHSEGHDRGVASAHGDVMHWFPKFGKSMDTFRMDVATKMKEEEDMTEQEVQKIVNKALADRDEAVAAANAKVAQFATEAWNEAKQAGIFDGTRPGAPLTRQEAAVIMKRLNAVGVPK